VIGFGIYGVYKPLPEGVNVASSEFTLNSGEVQFLADTTTHFEDGEKEYNQEIFTYILKMIAEAEDYILLDMFLFNNHLGTATTTYRSLSEELTTALITKKQNNPTISIQFITDPINSAYFGYEPEHLEQLQAAGIQIINTDLTVLRDSNPIYSAWWRAALRYLPAIGGDFLPNIFDTNKPKVSLPAYLRTLNFKANHRKLIVADYDDGGGKIYRSLITSLNPHDGSCGHSNVALVINNVAFAQAVIRSEAAVADFSEADFHFPLFENDDLADGVYKVQLLTEKAIKDSALAILEKLQGSDKVYLSMFYISDRDIVEALKAAAKRGVEMSLLFDANKDAFGREKNGIPNRQVAKELMDLELENVSLRWCLTQGEQCHSKLLLAEQEAGWEVILGSANYTRRNLENFNLETNVRLASENKDELLTEIQAWFDEEWEKRSVAYETYADDNLLRIWWYRVGEWSGLSHY